MRPLNDGENFLYVFHIIRDRRNYLIINLGCGGVGNEGEEARVNFLRIVQLLAMVYDVSRCARFGTECGSAEF